MPHLPDFAAFQRLADGHKLVPVYRRLLSDALTPVSAFHLLDRGSHACLFESVIGGEKVGRYSFLAFDPFLELIARGTQVTTREGGKSQTDSGKSQSDAGTKSESSSGSGDSGSSSTPATTTTSDTSTSSKTKKD